MDESISSDDDLRALVLAVTWTMTVVAGVFLAGRIGIKLRGRKALWWDDGVLAASWALLAAFAGITAWGVAHGLGTHRAAAQPATDPAPDPLQLVVVVATVCAALGAAWSKTSFALTLLRITGGSAGCARAVVWAVLVSVNAVLTANVVLQFVWCRPAAAAWNAGLGGECWPRAVVLRYGIAAAGYSAAMDMVLATVPWAVLMRMQALPARDKIGVAAAMSLGVFAGVTSIMRAVYIPSIYSHDYSFREGPLFMWTAAELATTIMAASIPVLRSRITSMARTARRKISMSKSKPRSRMSSSSSSVEAAPPAATTTTTTTTNTFKSGTYVFSTMSRPAGAAPPRVHTTREHPGLHVREESVKSLILDDDDDDDELCPCAEQRSEGQGKDLERGGIVMTEEVTVEFDERRGGGGTARDDDDDYNGSAAMRNAMLGVDALELDRVGGGGVRVVEPVFARSRPR